MPRILKEDEHAARRNEILDAVQRLVYTKGYRQMTIQDILDDRQISKGAFYHYFDSKHALLEALTERLQNEAVEFLEPIIQNPQLTALEKLQRYFDSVAIWKGARKSYLLELLRVWYTDDNAIFRQKMLVAGIEQLSPLLTEVIHQGIREGILTPSHPEQTGEVVFCLLQGLGESLARLFLTQILDPDALAKATLTTAAYMDALERVLGAPPNSLTITDPQTLAEWVAVLEKQSLVNSSQ